MKLLILAFHPNYISPETRQEFADDMLKRGIEVQYIAHHNVNSAPIYSVHKFDDEKP